MNLTVKQENFCLAYIEIGNATEAYRRAYDAENMQTETIHVKACELLKNGKVAVRVEELRAAQLERHLVTVDSLCLELEETRSKALESNQLSAAVSSTMGKAKLHGLGLEKRETKDTTVMTPERADEILKQAGMLQEAGDEQH